MVQYSRYLEKLLHLDLWPANKPDSSGEKESAVIDGVDGDGKVFGIRSYLHHFYVSSPNMEEVEPVGGAWYLLPPPPAQRMGLYFCRVITVLGLLLLLGGAASIIVGYCWHYQSDTSLEAALERIAIERDEEGNFYIPQVRFTEFLRDPMHTWKVAGFCVFVAGASLMALGLLVPTCAQCLGTTRLAAFASEDNTPNEPPVRIYPSAKPNSKFKVVPVSATRKTSGHKISPTSGPVPVMEEIAKVQPGSKKSHSPSSPNADEMLMNSGDSQTLLQQ